jgi:hypothetical protein
MFSVELVRIPYQTFNLLYVSPYITLIGFKVKACQSVGHIKTMMTKSSGNLFFDIKFERSSNSTKLSFSIVFFG